MRSADAIAAFAASTSLPSVMPSAAARASASWRGPMAAAGGQLAAASAAASTRSPRALASSARRASSAAFSAATRAASFSAATCGLFFRFCFGLGFSLRREARGLGLTGGLLLLLALLRGGRSGGLLALGGGAAASAAAFLAAVSAAAAAALRSASSAALRRGLGSRIVGERRGLLAEVHRLGRGGFRRPQRFQIVADGDALRPLALRDLLVERAHRRRRLLRGPLRFLHR